MFHISFDQFTSNPNARRDKIENSDRIGYFDDFDGYTRSKILNIVSRAMAHVDRDSRGELTEQREEFMLELICDADDAISRAIVKSRSNSAQSMPADLLITVVRTVAGYFRLKAGISKEDLLKHTVNPVVQALYRTPNLLNFPLGWHLCRCMRAFLTNHDDPKPMEIVMADYENRLPFVKMCCDGGRTIFERYSGWTWQKDPTAPYSPPSSPLYIPFPPPLFSQITPLPTPPLDPIGYTAESMNSIDNLLFRQGSFDMLRIAVPTMDGTNNQQKIVKIENDLENKCLEKTESFLSDSNINWIELANLSE
jgi:hypothetical protein